MPYVIKRNVTTICITPDDLNELECMVKELREKFTKHPVDHVCTVSMHLKDDEYLEIELY